MSTTELDVCVTDLRHERGGREVVVIAELRIRADRITAVIGPNGAGKSTLLRLIAGLDSPTEGDIHVGTDRVGAATRSHVAVAFQRPALLDTSVEANLDLALRLRGLARESRRARIARVADATGIVSLMRRRASSLSGGEAQRVNLARALSLEAPVCLLDEPLAGLDPIGRRQLLDQLPGLLERFATTVILVTHDATEARRLADDVVVLIEGRVRSAGSKQDVWSQPTDRAVAELLGYQVVTNRGRELAIHDGDWSLDGPGERLTVTIERVVDVVRGWEIIALVDSQRIRIPVSRRALDELGKDLSEGAPLTVSVGDAVRISSTARS